LILLRAAGTSTTSPVPSNAIELGSGTVLGGPADATALIVPNPFWSKEAELMIAPLASTASTPSSIAQIEPV
jgi:hypothetical protein